jgi:hypothetical protein
MYCDVRDDAFDSYRVSHVLSQGNLFAFQVPRLPSLPFNTNSFALSPLAKQPVTVLSDALDLPLLVVSWAEDPTDLRIPCAQSERGFHKSPQDSSEVSRPFSR